MKITEIKEIIKSTAAEYGFKTKDVSWSVLPQIKREENDYVAIIIQDKWDDFNFEKKEATRRVEVTVSICQMGGSPTPAELLIAAGRIKRGAELTAKLQSMDLSFKEQI